MSSSNCTTKYHKQCDYIHAWKCHVCEEETCEKGYSCPAFILDEIDVSAHMRAKHPGIFERQEQPAPAGRTPQHNLPTRIDEQPQGNKHSGRGGHQQPQGNKHSNRGGNQSNRGGNQQPQGNQPPQGHQQSNRGGNQQSNRGGNKHSNRGGNQYNRGNNQHSGPGGAPYIDQNSRYEQSNHKDRTETKTGGYKSTIAGIRIWINSAIKRPDVLPKSTEESRFDARQRDIDVYSGCRYYRYIDCVDHRDNEEFYLIVCGRRCLENSRWCGRHQFMSKSQNGGDDRQHSIEIYTYQSDDEYPQQPDSDQYCGDSWNGESYDGEPPRHVNEYDDGYY